MLTVATVLKSGGDFDAEYVSRLYRGVARCLSVEHQFVCLTDVHQIGVGVPLKHGLPGWWSKMEAFALKGPVLLLDLDTVIVGSIDVLAEAVLALPKEKIMMLRGFHHGDWTSGIVGWTGDFSQVLKQLTERIYGGEMRFDDSNRLHEDKKSYRGDQDWIRESLAGITPIVAVQDVFSGVFSYKVHVRNQNGRGLPEGASIICFHGKPRPHQVTPRPDWLEWSWKI